MCPLLPARWPARFLAPAVAGARWMMLCPNGLITIAVKNEEGNVSGGASWRWKEEDAKAMFAWGSSKMGGKGGYTPYVFKEWGSGFESRSCELAENECVQAVEKTGLKYECCSKRRAEFTYKYNVGESICQ